MSLGLGPLGTDRRGWSWGWEGGFGARAGFQPFRVCDSSVPKPGAPAEPLSSHSMPWAGKRGRLALGLQREQSPWRAGTGREFPLEQAEIPGNILFQGGQAAAAALGALQGTARFFGEAERWEVE